MRPRILVEPESEKGPVILTITVTVSENETGFVISQRSGEEALSLSQLEEVYSGIVDFCQSEIAEHTERAKSWVMNQQ